MRTSDDENLLLIDSVDSVDSTDRLNARFYGRFPYPWAPMKFEYLLDPHFETVMLNQALGDWDHSMVPRNPEVWVAGCGTNQAVYTALRFPKGRVTGSDISQTSLGICRDTASRLGIDNLTLREESLNHVEYEEQFDHILCTGVIHHNASPEGVLARLTRALKPGGILELMVYNRYHSIVPSAIQKAIHILQGGEGGGAVDFDRELALAYQLMEGLQGENSVTGFLRSFRTSPESMLADRLFQPVEQSYTVESFAALAASCGLELVAPCLNSFDLAAETFSWNIDLGSPELQRAYEALPDVRRWHVSNLLLHEKSPQIWFYLQRCDAPRSRRTEKEICEDFLDRELVRSSTVQRNYLRGEDGRYNLSPNSVPYPVGLPDPFAQAVYEQAAPGRSMREIFAQLGIPTDLLTVNRIRILLTTPAFPYLTSLPETRRTSETSGDRERREISNRERLRSVSPKAVQLPPSEGLNS